MIVAKLAYHDNQLFYTPGPGPSDQVKEIGGRKDKASGRWAFPPVYATIKGLERIFGKESLQWTPATIARFGGEFGFPRGGHSFDHLPGDLWDVLDRYQLDGIAHMNSTPNPGSMLCLSPGLGKTLTAIAASVARGDDHVLIVAPFSLLWNWYDEILKWTGQKAVVLHGQVPKIGNTRWVITNYETLVKYAQVHTGTSGKKKVVGVTGFEDIPWDRVLVDESVLVKNHDILRWMALSYITKRAMKTHLLTGSPTTRHADDLYGQFGLAFPGAFTSYWRFASTYCHVVEDKWGSQIIGTRSNIDFQDEFRDLMFIRHQKDVLELPDMLFETVMVDLVPEQRRMYDQMLEEFLIELEDETLEATTRMSQLIRLLQIVSTPWTLGDSFPVASGKLDALIELIDVGRIPKPSIIWTHWSRSTILVQEALKRKGFRVGNMLEMDRQEVVRDFQAGNLDFLVLSLGKGKYGFTLTEAQSAVYFDKIWDGDAYYQSLQRIQRRGLNHSPLIISLQARHTVDQLVAENLEGKMKTISQVSNADLKVLLAGLRHENG